MFTISAKLRIGSRQSWLSVVKRRCRADSIISSSEAGTILKHGPTLQRTSGQNGQIHQQHKNLKPRAKSDRSNPSFRRATEALVALENAGSTGTEEPTTHAQTHLQGQVLPLSPLMDPVLAKNRSRMRQPKTAGRPGNDLERSIATNPFAKILATPSRMCSISEARVPSGFLRPFTLGKDPNSDTILQIPRDLDSRLLDSKDFGPGTNDASNLEEKGFPLSNQSGTSVHGKLSTCWVASTQTAMQYMARSVRSRRKSRHKRVEVVTTPRWRSLPHEISSRIATRPDHEAFVHQLMRKESTRELALLPALHADAEEGNLSIISCPIPTENTKSPAHSIEEYLQDTFTAARPAPLQNWILVWVGDSSAEESRSNLEKRRLFGTPLHSIQDPLIRMTRNRTLPVLDAETLLGNENMDVLRSRHSLFRHSAVAIRQIPATQRALMWLWKLQLYHTGGK